MGNGLRRGWDTNWSAAAAHTATPGVPFGLVGAGQCGRLGLRRDAARGGDSPRDSNRGSTDLAAAAAGAANQLEGDQLISEWFDKLTCGL